MEKVKHFSKKYALFLGVSALGYFLVPDVATFITSIFRIAECAFVSLLWLLIIGHGKGWGIFTDLDIAELYKNSINPDSGLAAIGSAIVLLGLVILICVTCICVIF